MDSEEAPPPPYSAVDPNPNNTRIASGINGGLLHLRGGNSPLSIATSGSSSSSVLIGSPSSPSSRFTPANFESAVAYFTERPPTVLDDGREILHHHLTIYPRSQAKDFPRRPRCWNSRNGEITQQDWDMFLRYLFPPHLGLASTSGHLSRQLRAQIQRDRKDRPQETDEQRKLRVTAVVTEWNQCFFEPRAARLLFSYITDPGHAPTSSLCPKCYPAATRANQESRSSRTQSVFGRGRQSSQSSTPPAAQGHPATPPANNGYAHGTYPYPQQYGGAPVPYAQAPYSQAAFYPPAAPHNTYPTHAYSPQPQQPYNYQQPYQWGWNNRQYPPPQSPSSGSSKGGPLGWISSLASHITEQAERYGDKLSAHAEHYGRQVEEQAIAHGRWLEEQAGLSGRKAQSPYAGYPRPDPRYQYYNYYNNYPYHYYHQPNATTNVNPSPVSAPTTPAAAAPATGTTAVEDDNEAHNANITTQRTIAQPNLRHRSLSIASTTSDSSFTSIDSLSTTSELSSSDLGTVRAQLLSLEDHHDRNLYEAAVGLRRQLDVIRESNRQSRSRNGWGQYDDRRGGSWNQPQRSWTERRAMKDEMRATKKAFRDVLRRAREEQREKRRMRRSRRRQEQQRLQQLQRDGAEVETAPLPASSHSHSRSAELPLEQRLQNLELEREKAKKHASQPTVRSSASFPSTARSISSVESSEVSSISTPSTASLHEGDHQNESRASGEPQTDSNTRRQSKEQKGMKQRK